MGDILGSVFGGGKQSAETQTADPISQAGNQLRYQQLANLFQNQAYSDYGVMRPDIFSLDQRSSNLLDQFTNSDNLMSLQDYLDLGTKSGQNYLTQIASPEMASNLSLQGMQDSGAMQEALAKAGASIGMDFLKTIPAFKSVQNQQMGQLFSMAQTPQNLRQQDYLRTQGVVTTGLTGLPYTPTISKQGEEGSLPLFNLFGMGNSL